MSQEMNAHKIMIRVYLNKYEEPKSYRGFVTLASNTFDCYASLMCSFVQTEYSIIYSSYSGVVSGRVLNDCYF